MSYRHLKLDFRNKFLKKLDFFKNCKNKFKTDQ